MTSPGLSVVIPAFNEQARVGDTVRIISDYLRATGLSYEVLVVDDGSTDTTTSLIRSAMEQDPALHLISLPSNQGKGAAVKRGVQEARGEVVAFIDADLPYSVQNLGNVIALVQSGATDIAIGGRDLRASDTDYSYPVLRRLLGKTFSLIVRGFLVPDIPDTQCGLKAFSREAARKLFSESKICGFGFDFEVLYLARKYGYRIERIPVSLTHRHESKVRLIRDSAGMLLDVYRVRRYNRQMAYHSPRRCPVCFSGEVWSLTQIKKHVIRKCSRCKCRYLATFPEDEELVRLYNADYFNSGEDLMHGYASGELTTASRKTNERRMNILRKSTSAGARVLEVGAGTGLFGHFVAREFEYVGIDLSDKAVRHARTGGIDVYLASLMDFVNTGPSFDALTMFHVFEHLANPHDALGRVKELLKPGGVVILVTPDTESLLCAISGDSWVSYKFPEHLILYSRSALIELLEHSGFEIVSATGDYEYCSHEFLLSRLKQLSSAAARVAPYLLAVLPDPLLVGSGSIRIVAKRRAGSPFDVRGIRAVEPTHAR